MFENYIDELTEELDGMTDQEVRIEFQAFKRQPQAGFEKHIEKNLDTSEFSTIQKLEAYIEELWDEFSEKTVSSTYQKRLGRLYKTLEIELSHKTGRTEDKRIKI